MFSTCNTACVGASELSKNDQCATYQRSEVPVRLLVAKCNVDFPEGDYDDNVLATAIETLITNGEVSATPELSNVEWSDPTNTTKQFRARNRPASVITTGRTFTARDYNAFDVNSAGTATPYDDRIIYLDEIQAKSTRIVGYITDSGKIYLFLDKNGAFMSYSPNFFTGWDNEVDGQTIEFKNYVINFVSDPLARLSLPYLDIIGANAVAQLGWLYQNAQ